MASPKTREKGAISVLDVHVLTLLNSFSAREGVLRLLLSGLPAAMGEEKIKGYLKAREPDLEVLSVTVMDQGRSRVEVVGLKG